MLFLSNWTQVYSCDLQGKDHLTSLPINAPFITKLVAVPGLLFVHTVRGLSLLHPYTLTPVEIVGLNSESSKEETEQELSSASSSEKPIIQQFEVEEALFGVLKIWDDEFVASKEEDLKASSPSTHQDKCSLSPSQEKLCLHPENTQDEVSPKPDFVGHFGRCVVGLFVNNRLVVLSTGNGSVSISSVLLLLLWDIIPKQGLEELKFQPN